MQFTFYERSGGVSCYAAPLFDPKNLSQVMGDLQSSDLIWWWLSVRRDVGETRGAVASPEIRHLTQLTTQSETWFAEDTKERDTDGFLRSIVLIGTSRVDPFQNAADLRSVLTSFAAGEPNQIEIVISQVGDSEVELIFLRRDPPPVVRDLLKRWGLEETKATDVREYRTLWTASLEELIDSITSHAFGANERPA
jgi:hypothetical protein